MKAAKRLNFEKIQTQNALEHCLNEIGQSSNATLPAKARERISQGEPASPLRDILMRNML